MAGIAPVPTDRFREHRRARRVSLVLACVVVASASGYLVSRANPARKGTSRGVIPVEISGIAAEPNGDLLLTDSTRNQVLEWHPNAGFTVLAGDGVRGFSGDGGSATRASLDQPAGIVASGGVVYFLDQGNDRVRAILPNGTIETVIGDGAAPKSLVMGPTPATQVGVHVTDIALAPSGSLYISADQPPQVLRLARGDVAPVPGPFKGQSVSSALPGRGYIDQPGPIAVDRSGDLFVFDWGGGRVDEITPKGTASVVGDFNDFHATLALATAPNEQTVVASYDGLQWLSGPPLAFGPTANAGINGAVSAIAFAPDGDVDAAVDAGQFSPLTKLLQVSPSGRAKVLWISHRVFVTGTVNSAELVGQNDVEVSTMWSNAGIAPGTESCVINVAVDNIDGALLRTLTLSQSSGVVAPGQQRSRLTSFRVPGGLPTGWRFGSFSIDRCVSR